MRKAIILSILFIIISTILVGCTEKKDNKVDKDKLTVYATVYPLQYFTERIAGDLVTVSSIYPPNADEHTFEPSQRDMMKLADADVFFYIGLGLEGFVEKARTTLKNEGVQFIPLGESILFQMEKSGLQDGVEHEETEHEEHEHEDVDPHVWLDPIYANELALAIKKSLLAELPEKKLVIEENYQQLASELKELDSSFRTTISDAKHKEVIVSHAAFGYWESRYGLQQISISGLSSATEPSQKKLEKIVNLAKEKNLNYILFEQNVSLKLGEIIQHEIGAKPLAIHNLSTLTEENIQMNETYFSLMYHNIESLRIALNK
jgi:zinc transport system substrate-binding protein